jgi:ribonuclease HI
MSQDPESRRYVPSEIWDAGYDLCDLECYISNERFVLGRCDACKICDYYCIANDEIELTRCLDTDECWCGARRAHGDAIIIATDGACRNNGYPDAEAACGIFCNVNSNNNKSFKLTDARPTNQRAELYAAVHALRTARNMFANGNLNRHLSEVVIKTDSAYLVNSMTSYIIKWRNNDYTNARGLPVVNQDLFRELDVICNRLADIGVQARFWRVPRDQNMQADKLANAALDGVDWKTFSEDDWFEGGSKPYIHRRDTPTAGVNLYAVSAYRYDSSSSDEDYY